MKPMTRLGIVVATMGAITVSTVVLGVKLGGEYWDSRLGGGLLAFFVAAPALNAIVFPIVGGNGLAEALRADSADAQGIDTNSAWWRSLTPAQQAAEREKLTDLGPTGRAVLMAPQDFERNAINAMGIAELRAEIQRTNNSARLVMLRAALAARMAELTPSARAGLDGSAVL